MEKWNNHCWESILNKNILNNEQLLFSLTDKKWKNEFRNEMLRYNTHNRRIWKIQNKHMYSGILIFIFTFSTLFFILPGALRTTSTEYKTIILSFCCHYKLKIWIFRHYFHFADFAFAFRAYFTCAFEMWHCQSSKRQIPNAQR